MARPTEFKREYATQARKLCLLGATDPELADFFGVSRTTIKTWKKKHPEFLAALNEGKETADAQVAEKLYRRAMGYSHKAVKIITVPRGNNQGSDVEQVPYVERYPPDVTACIFWLKNRRPAQWRDRPPEEDSEDSQEIARAVRSAVKAIMEADGLRLVA